MKTQLAIFLTLLLLVSVNFLSAQDTVRADSCPGALSSRLVNGARGRILPGAPNRLRDEPSTEADIGAKITTGESVTLLDGPICAESIAWWQVEYLGRTGWMAEGQGDAYWLEPSLLPDLEPISAANANCLQPIAMLGANLINEVAFSPDGQTLLAAGSAGLWRFDLTRPEMPPYLVEGYEGFFRSVAYSPDGKFAATGSDTGAIRLWDTATWTESAVLRESGASVEKIAFSADGALLAWGDFEGIVQVWDIERHQFRLNWDIDPHVTDLTFNPIDNNVLVVAHYRGVSAINLRTQTKGEWGAVERPESLAFSADGSLLAVGASQPSGDGTGRSFPLIFFDSKTGDVLASILMVTSSIQSLAFADTHTLILSGSDNTEVWQVNDLLNARPLTDEELSTLGFGRDQKPHFADIDTIDHRSLPGGELFHLDATRTQLAVVNWNEIHIVDVETGSSKAILHLPFFDQTAQGMTRILVFSPTQPLLAFGMDNNIQLIDVRTGVPKALLIGHRLDITALAFSPDGRLLASGSGDFPDYGNTQGENGGVRVWNMPDGSLKSVLQGYRQPVGLLRFSADGNILFTSYNFGAEGGNAGTWNLATQTQVALPEYLSFLSFSSRSPLAALSSTEYGKDAPRSRLALWDMQRNLQIPLKGSDRSYPDDIVFSPDGKPVVMGRTLWDVETGAATSINLSDLVLVAPPVFSPDGSLLAYPGDDGLVLWDWQAGVEKLKIPMEGIIGPVFFCPDGSLVYTNTRLWDVQTGALTANLLPPHLYFDGPSDWWPTASVSADGRVIAVHSGYGIRLWGVPGE